MNLVGDFGFPEQPGLFFKKALREGVRVTDEAALVERLGVRVRVVEGDPRNLKVTVPADLEIARAFLREAAGQGPRGEGA